AQLTFTKESFRGGSNRLLAPIFRTANVRSAERPALSPLAGFPADLRRAVSLPFRSAASALLLGRGRLLHPGRLRSLSHWRTYSVQHAIERASAAARGLPRALVEALRLQPADHASGLADRGFVRAAGGLPPGPASHRPD